MFYPSVPPVPINVPLLTGACSFSIGLFLWLALFYHCIVYARCQLVMHFFHARLMREFNKV